MYRCCCNRQSDRLHEPGSICLHTLHSLLADRIFKPEKNKEVRYLGELMKKKQWKSQLLIVLYSLLPCHNPLVFGRRYGTPKTHPNHPGLFSGEVVSDSIAIRLGKVASENFQDMIHAAFSWKSIASLLLRNTAHSNAVVCRLALSPPKRKSSN